MLDMFGMQVTTVADGSEALQQIASADVSGRPFDLALIDWQMPGGARRLRVLTARRKAG